MPKHNFVCFGVVILRLSHKQNKPFLPLLLANCTGYRDPGWGKVSLALSLSLQMAKIPFYGVGGLLKQEMTSRSEVVSRELATTPWHSKEGESQLAWK